MTRALFLAALLTSTSAWAHSDGAMHYPPRCCGGTDCSPLEGLGAVERHNDGWFIPASGETIPFDKTEPSEDLRFHRCVFQSGTMKGKTRCFFSPETAG